MQIKVKLQQRVGLQIVSMAQYSEIQIVRKPICPTVKCCKIYLCNYHYK